MRYNLDKEEAKKTLLEWIKPGDTIHLILRQVSRSGMSRAITPIVFLNNDDGLQIRYLGYKVATLLGRKQHKTYSDAVVMDGCGMDTGFELVYELSYALFGDGYKLKHHWL